MARGKEPKPRGGGGDSQARDAFARVENRDAHGCGKKDVQEDQEEK